MSKFCTNCGNQIEEGAAVCSQCGTKVEAETAVKAKFDPIAWFKGLDQTVRYITLGVVGVLVIAIVLISAFSGGGYTKPVDNFFDGFISGDADKMMKAFPEEVVEELEDSDYFDLDDIEDMLDELVDELEDEYGKRVKFSYKVEEKDSLSEKKLDALKDELKDSYGISKKDVKDAMTLELEMTIKGSEDKDSEDMEMTVVKIGGKWYLSPDALFNLY